MEAKNDFVPVDFGCVACAGDISDPDRASESVYDARLLLRIVYLGALCVLIAMGVLILVFGDQFVNVFIPFGG